MVCTISLDNFTILDADCSLDLNHPCSIVTIKWGPQDLNWAGVAWKINENHWIYTWPIRMPLFPRFIHSATRNIIYKYAVHYIFNCPTLNSLIGRCMVQFFRKSYALLKSIITPEINFKFQPNRSNCLDVWSIFFCCSCSECVSLIMVIMINHIFTNIFQTKHSPVKFLMGYKKNTNELSFDIKTH